MSSLLQKPFSKLIWLRVYYLARCLCESSAGNAGSVPPPRRRAAPPPRAPRAAPSGCRAESGEERKCSREINKWIKKGEREKWSHKCLLRSSESFVLCCVKKENQWEDEAAPSLPAFLPRAPQHDTMTQYTRESLSKPPERQVNIWHTAAERERGVPLLSHQAGRGTLHFCL